MKKWILMIILILMCVQTSTATIYHAEGEDHGNAGSLYSHIGTLYNDDYYTYYYHIYISHQSCVGFKVWIYDKTPSTHHYLVDDDSCCWGYPPYCHSTRSGSFSSHWESSLKEPVTDLEILIDPHWYEYYSYSQTLITSTHTYNISGTIGCINTINLYINNSGSWLNLVCDDDVSGDTFYSYNVSHGYEYKIVFDDHEYEFVCNGSDIEYNYNICEFTTINILDNCYNLLIYPHTVVYDRDQGMKLVYDGYDNPVNIDMSTNNISDGDVLSISWLTEAGRIDKNVFAHPNYTQNVYDPIISWNLNVIVTNSTLNPIENAKVYLTQDCSICDGTRFGYTNNNGSIMFNCLEGDSFVLHIEKSGYDTYNASINLSATAQCLDYGINIQLSGNNSITNITNNTQTAVWFTDPSGNVVNQVNDTVEYVDLHYQIFRYDNEDMDLRFQRSLNTSWYTIWAKYLISNGSTGYYRIYRSGNFSNCGLYRGYLSNDEASLFDQIAKLRVVNESNETESHLENLTAWCWLWNTEYDGKIDYHEDIECVIYANSTNSSLLTIYAKFYEDSTLKDSKTLNWADFISGDLKYYYKWYPDYEYKNNHNYTLKIYGYDNTLLDTDSAYTSSIRGLKLTINVVDQDNNPLTNAHCYVEGWGSLYTEYNSYAIMKGLSSGSYHYRAEKGGYRSTGWATINMSDDTSVTYTLYQDTTEHATRMEKTDVKALFYPFMFILLIIMLVGGLVHVFD